jgi:outer membrane protein assembly factor BamA
MTTRQSILLSFALMLLIAPTIRAQAILHSVDGPDTPQKQEALVPIAFYSERTNFGAGLAGAFGGYLQPQFFFGGAAFGSTNASYGFYFLGKDLQLQPIDRLFFDAKIGITKFQDSQEYVDGDPLFPGTAGANNSNPHDYVTSSTFSAYGEYTFKYILPIGGGEDDLISNYTVEHGVMRSGADGATSWWNPFASGRTYVELTPFTYWRDINPVLPIADRQENSFGLRLAMRWDNTDFTPNPSRGNMTTVRLSRDFGIFNSLSEYTVFEFEHSQYIPLGQSSWFRQQVLALNFWTAADFGGNAPYYAGATLGGYDRLRAYDFYRFHDRDAIFGSAELRLMPRWNPTTTSKTLDRLAQIDWVQLVGFVEAGRVGHDYSTNELLSDMKFDGGIGIRLLMHKSVVRADFAVGSEGATAWLMFGQSF